MLPPARARLPRCRGKLPDAATSNQREDHTSVFTTERGIMRKFRWKKKRAAIYGTYQLPQEGSGDPNAGTNEINRCKDYCLCLLTSHGSAESQNRWHACSQ